MVLLMGDRKMTCILPLLNLALAIAIPAPAAAQASTDAARAEVEIRDVVLTDGAHRYAIPITVGSASLDAGLDTGSTGLRVLPGTLEGVDARPISETRRYRFDSGVELAGAAAIAEVAIGALAAEIPLQIVVSVGCAPLVPRCPAAKVPPDRYRLEGDGLPDQGFPAILGLGSATGGIPNPAVALGAKRWIVELPRPDVPGTPGRLILNPREDEVAGFTPLGPAPQGCIADDTTHARECGTLVLDTGAPGIRVVGAAGGPRAWPSGSPATLTFAGAPLTERFRVNNGLATRMSFERSDHPGTTIYLGPLPYFVFAVLYGPAPGAIALKPR